VLRIQWAEQKLELHPEKAVYWPVRRTLLIADAHFGKTASFRQAGLPVPEDTTAADTGRLSQLLRKTGAGRLIVLGDLLHAQAAHEEATRSALEEWRAVHRQLEIILVEGNHDRRAGGPAPHLDIRTVAQPLVEAPLAFCHEPAQHEGVWVLAGHVHPAVRLHDGDGSTLRAPCFWFGQHVAVLPAFGGFTGAHAVRPRAGDRVYAVGPDVVVQVAPPARGT
jgi:DNA ligase-associated metallophosphoesterase